MRELSLHILDIVQNSLIAGARRVEIAVCADESTLKITVADDGRGMSAAMAMQVTDPFVTSRTTRRVGLGLPLFAQACEMCGGALAVESEEGAGTVVRARLLRGHIDCPPMGNMAETLWMLCLTSGNADIVYRQSGDGVSICIDTKELRERLDTPRLEAGRHGAWLRAEIAAALGQLPL